MILAGLPSRSFAAPDVGFAPFGPPPLHYGVAAPNAFGAGGKGIRTPDFQLAKLALYQLSYAPGLTDFRRSIFARIGYSGKRGSRFPARERRVNCDPDQRAGQIDQDIARGGRS